MHKHNFTEKMTLGIGATLGFPRFYEPRAIEHLGAEHFFPALEKFLHPEVDPQYMCNWEIRFIFAFALGDVDFPPPKQYAKLEAIEITESGHSFVTVSLLKTSIEINLSHPLISAINDHLAKDGASLQDLCAEVIEDCYLSVRKEFIWITGQDFDTDDSMIPAEHLWGYLNNPYYPTHISSRSRQKLDVVLQYLIFSPLRDVGNVARGLTRVGPLRVIPELEQLQFWIYRHQLSSGIAQSARSFGDTNYSLEDGSPCWTSLAANCEVRFGDFAKGGSSETSYSRKIVELVNEWLTSPERLDMDCLIEIATREISDDAMLSSKQVSTWGGTRTTAERASGIAVLRLRKPKLGVLVAVHDVGVGIAQVIPILVTGFTALQAFIEQPELHLHPRLQMQIADFFSLAWNQLSHRFIVETHSEYLALRLLRRLRETSRGQVPRAEFSLRPEDLAFYYFNPVDGVTEVKRLRATPAGDFLDRWPQGFFAEREGELFDDAD